MADSEDSAATEFAWPYTYTFKQPANALGELVESITLREPSAADLLKANVFDGQITGEQMLTLVATLSGKSTALINALPGVEMLKLTAQLSKVFQKAVS